MLIDALQRHPESRNAASFQLAGEDLSVLGGDDIGAAVDKWRYALAQIPEPLRTKLLRFHREAQAEAHAFLRAHSRSVHARIAGYLELAQRCNFLYPWPIVAVVGIEQVLTQLAQRRLFGTLVQWFGSARQMRGIDASEDMLRRTNRSIFGDSVPTVLFALRIHALRGSGGDALAETLLTGPLPPLFDESCRSLMRDLVDGLGIVNEAERFAALARLTLTHFEREQAIFTYHLGAGAPIRATSVVGPMIRGHRLVWRRQGFPAGFDLRDHRARTDALSDVFVRAVTGSEADYRVATAHVQKRFGKR